MMDRQRQSGFEDLKCWQRARQLMLACHQLADRLPSNERYDLASQIRRSSKSGMAHISEGYGLMPQNLTRPRNDERHSPLSTYPLFTFPSPHPQNEVLSHGRKTQDSCCRHRRQFAHQR